MLRTLAASLVIVIGLSIFASGCQSAKADSAWKPNFVGTWKTIASATDVGSNATMTLNADQTVSLIATNGPKQSPYKLSSIGTWQATDKQLTVTPVSMRLDNVAPKDRTAFKGYLSQVNIPQVSPVEWNGNDEFVLTTGGVKQDFKRVQ